MSNILIFGGSKGLGLEIAEALSIHQKIKPIVISRNASKVIKSSKQKDIRFLDINLADCTIETLLNIYKEYYPISGICFAQRYRSNLKLTKKDDDNQEYLVMVRSIALATQALINYFEHFKIKTFKTRIVVIGSTYSVSSGYDQEWNYHACKAAQYSLVKFYALRSEGRFNINMISPATYIKSGAKKYWEKSEKSTIWSNYPTKELSTALTVANETINLITNSSIFNSGNNIFVDGGVSHLYHDQ